MKKQCNFCGRSEKEVKLLITGIDGYICEDCAQQAYRIVEEHVLKPAAAKQGVSKAKEYGMIDQVLKKK